MLKPELVSKVYYCPFERLWYAVQYGEHIEITPEQAQELDWDIYNSESANWKLQKNKSVTNPSTPKNFETRSNPFADDFKENRSNPFVDDFVVKEKSKISKQSRVTKTPNHEKFFDKSTFMPVWLGRAIKQDHLKHCFFDGQILYRYDNGIYKPDGEAFVRKVAQQLLVDQSRKRYIDETLYWINQDSLVEDKQQINPDDELINLKNGLLNWRSKKLLPHDPKRLSTVQFPVCYDTKANDSDVLQFLKEVIPLDTVDTLLEFVGYCLVPNRNHHRALMLTGTGANGKSTLIKFVEALIGDENMTHIPLQQLETDRFMTARLYGKMLNTFADLPAKGLDKCDVFKMITGDDSLTGQFKGKDSFEFKPFCKLIFSANEIPHSDDTTDGFFRRWIIIPFPNKFEGKNKDTNKTAKLTSSAALSTLLNLAIEGIRRLEQYSDFTESETTKRTRLQYRKSTDSVSTFVEECCVLGEGLQYHTSFLYDAYEIFCKETGLRLLSKIAFNNQLKAKCRLDDYKKVKGKGYYWNGIKLRDDFESLPRRLF